MFDLYVHLFPHALSPAPTLSTHPSFTPIIVDAQGARAVRP